VGISRVPDERLDRLTALFNPKKRTPATVEFADLAAARGGTAQALLDVVPFRNADALVHVLRLFRDEAIPHPKGSIDAARDARAMEEEMILADLGVAERRLERLEKDLKKSASAELRKEQEILLRCREALEAAESLRALELPPDDAKRLRGFQLLSAKPLLLVLNVDEEDFGPAKAGDDRQSIHVSTAGQAAKIGEVTVCAKIELEIAQLEPADAAAFLADLGRSESGLDRVIRASYDLLGYISFFTVGEDECRAWSIPRGTPAQLGAGEIHSDIARGFIRAEVARYDDLLARGSIAACRDHGELRLEGKDYVVQDGDVINFRFAT
jgi:GTP-binding protein YchF